MGYREDGSFNFRHNTLSSVDNPQENKYGITEGGKVNPKFEFPDKSIRFLEAEAALQLVRELQTNTLTRGDYKIHRGYIRNLEQPAFGEVPISRCNFQFNPQEIRQDVAMREDIYLPLLQTPEQLSQPLGGTTNFTFDLLFDRSHEVAAGQKRQEVETVADLNSANPTTDPNNISSVTDPYDIGVLADLRILYSVIGQGFSAEMLKFQMTSFKSSADLQSKRTEEEFDKDDPKTDVTIEDVIKANYGNFALLMPNPVRVMFSSLFMLDGFITGTSVNFLKFSTKMVPLQCRVTMNMQAMYIGFARQQTFLTHTFEQAAKALAQTNNEKEAALAELRKALITSANRFTIAPTWSNISTEQGSWTRVANGTIASGDWLPVWAQAVDDLSAERASSGSGTVRALFLGFPNIKPVAGSGTTTTENGTETTTSGRDIDKILELFEADKQITISYSWYIRVYGRKVGFINSASTAQAFITNKNYSSQLTLLGSYGATETASTKEQWGSGTGRDATAEKIRRRSIRGTTARQQAEQLKNGGDPYVWYGTTNVSEAFKNAYYIVEKGVTVTATMSEGTSLTASNENVKVYQGTARHDDSFLLNWTTGANDGYYVTTTLPADQR